MTQMEFKRLSEVDQIRMLNMYGILLGDRSSGFNRIYLYAISSFYIELFHELYDTRKSGLRILRTFEDTALLDEYLTNILIPDMG